MRAWPLSRVSPLPDQTICSCSPNRTRTCLDLHCVGFALAARSSGPFSHLRARTHGSASTSRETGLRLAPGRAGAS
jgi:hypothetical protein